MFSFDCYAVRSTNILLPVGPIVAHTLTLSLPSSYVDFLLHVSKNKIGDNKYQYSTSYPLAAVSDIDAERHCSFGKYKNGINESTAFQGIPIVRVQVSPLMAPN